MTVAVRLPLEVALELKQLAQDSYEGSMSRTISGLLHHAGGLSGTTTEDESYNAGLRQGLHEAKVLIREALEKKWR